jgi:hypothetical protein
MLHRTKLHQILKRLGNAIFHITWIKKDGSERTANARCKVHKGIKGTGRRINQPHNANISIYLMGNEKGYRTLNLDTVRTITCYGIEAKVTPDPIENNVDLSVTHLAQPDNVIEYEQAS